MNSSALTRHEVQVVREYEDDPVIIVDKHQVLQTLVNLIRNAKYACDESGRSNKQIKLRIGRNGSDRVRIQVADNGVGGARLAADSGLAGLRDRLEALDAQLLVESKPRHGTSISAEIPCGS